jgi:hypothetical protein
MSPFRPHQNGGGEVSQLSEAVPEILRQPHYELVMAGRQLVYAYGYAPVRTANCIADNLALVAPSVIARQQTFSNLILAIWPRPHLLLVSTPSIESIKSD